MSRFTKPSQAAEAASSQWFKPADHVNALVLFQPTEHDKAQTNPFFEANEPVTKKNNPTRDAIKATVVTFDASGEPTVYADQNLVQSSLIAKLKGGIGALVLGRLVKRKNGRYFSYDLADATPADEAIAEAYLATTEEAPF